MGISDKSSMGERPRQTGSAAIVAENERGVVAGPFAVHVIPAA